DRVPAPRAVRLPPQRWAGGGSPDDLAHLVDPGKVDAREGRKHVFADRAVPLEIAARRRALLLELVHRLDILFRASPREGVAILCGDRAVPSHHLTRAHERTVEIGPLLGDEHAKIGTKRVAEEDDLLG